MVWLSEGEKIEYTITHFDKIHERDRRTYKRADTAISRTSKSKRHASEGLNHMILSATC